MCHVSRVAITPWTLDMATSTLSPLATPTALLLLRLGAASFALDFGRLSIDVRHPVDGRVVVVRRVRDDKLLWLLRCAAFLPRFTATGLLRCVVIAVGKFRDLHQRGAFGLGRRQGSQLLWQRVAGMSAWPTLSSPSPPPFSPHALHHAPCCSRRACRWSSRRPCRPLQWRRRRAASRWVARQAGLAHCT
jgi:hypothetical protein